MQASGSDDFETLAKRFLQEGMPASLLASANPGRSQVRRGTWYRIPVGLLTHFWRVRALRALFPGDGPAEAGWLHRPALSAVDTYGEGAWEVALWYTGDGRNFATILRSNGLTDPILPRSGAVLVPAHLLLPPLRTEWEDWLRSSAPAERSDSTGTSRETGSGESARGETRPIPPPADVATRQASQEGLPSADHPTTIGPAADAESAVPVQGRSRRTDPRGAADGPAPEESDAGATGAGQAGSGLQDLAEGDEPGAAATHTELEYGSDRDGEFAVYRLRAGEALYSAVVIRYTGRIDPDDVAEAAARIARRSGIADVTDIPIGFAVKIPHSMLLPEYLPEGDPRRKAVEAGLKEAEKIRNPVRSKNLEGIHVILDAGHGGVDPGALIAGVAEHEYVYDVLCRIKRILETETAAVVHPLIKDPVTGFTPRSGRMLPPGGGEVILSKPAHVNGVPGETSLGVNLRWYLANSIHRRLVKSGVDSSRVVFASLHADVLHPSIRGAMVYVPGERYRRGTYGCGSSECRRFSEVREAPSVSFSRAERIASEGLSRQFASRIIQSLKSRGIRVHPELPVRDRIVRDGRAWLPAVLRGNAVPVKLLFEVANLNNPQDRALIQDPAFRESVARAFTEALRRYYQPTRAPGRSQATQRPSGARGR